MIEFDWFAVDAEGAIGVFATGGLGPVPAQVVSHSADHRRAAFQLALPDSGSLAVWEDFARYGLYVFDWQPHQGPYVKMHPLLAEMPPAFQEQLSQIRELPVLSVHFRTTSSVELNHSQ